MPEELIPEHPQPSSRRGGRRPGAGAKRGNINALKTGRYSNRVRALRGVLQALPQHKALLAGMTRGDKRRAETLGYALMFYGEIVLHIAGGGSLDDVTEAQLRDRLIEVMPLNQTRRIVDALQGAFGGATARPVEDQPFGEDMFGV